MPAAADTMHELPAVEARLDYLAPMAEKPRIYAVTPPPGVAPSNLQTDRRICTVRSARALRDRPLLDDMGFALTDAPSMCRRFDDEAEIRSRYYPESAALLKAATGADRVVVFDHTVRRRVAGLADRTGAGPRQPATRIHADQTERSGPMRIRHELGADAEDLLRGRTRIVNLWRPIHVPAWDRPLAVCAASSVTRDDLVATDLVFADRTGETYSLVYNALHRWFYVPGMTPDEALLLKCYDSLDDGRARFVPHSAFTDPSTPADAPPRESIELRAMLFG